MMPNPTFAQSDSAEAVALVDLIELVEGYFAAAVKAVVEADRFATAVVLEPVVKLVEFETERIVEFVVVVLFVAVNSADFGSAFEVLVAGLAGLVVEWRCQIVYDSIEHSDSATWRYAS